MANFKCPYCGAPYYNVRITRHGPVTCGRCRRVFRI